MKYKGLLLFTIFTCLLTLTNHVEIEAQTITTSDYYSNDLKEVDEFNNIVIFIKFANETNYNAPFDYDYYYDLFNGDDMISLKDYFLEASYNQLTINSYIVSENDTILYYQDDKDRGYYQPQSDTNPEGYLEEGVAEREHELLKKAIDWVDENNLVPQSIDLDTNNDGDIDSLTFMVSGEDNGWMSLFWPHKWSLTTYYNYSQGRYRDNAPEINGKHAFDYTFELLGRTADYDYKVDVGVLAHETFHLISAPDLYHYYRYDWITPVGDWGIMDGTGEVPSHMLGYMKYEYGGWVNTVPTITTSGSYRLDPLQDSQNNIYRISIGDNQHLYLEYRDNDGLYESTLPESGLIIYRVDNDYQDWGNEEGYYSSTGVTQEEVWLFRPGMADTTPPFTFESEDPIYDVDGDIEDAALSDNNPFNQAGYNTDIPFFDESGNLVELKIYNVIEHDGYITFDVLFGRLSVNIANTDLTIDDKVNFVDLPGTYYAITISDIEDNHDVYYTTDGTTPTTSSSLYDGTEIEITSTNNTLKLAVYNGTELVTSFHKEFTFVSNIETPHDGYGDNNDEYWYLNFEELTYLEFLSDENFSLSRPEDFLHISVDGVIQNSWQGSDFASTTKKYTANSYLFNLVTDDINNGNYGFKIDTNIIKSFSGLGYYLLGEEELYLYPNETYTEAGYKIVGDGWLDAYVQTDSNLDTTTPGDYTITYEIYNGNDELVDTLTRTIHIGDYEAPIVSLRGNSHVYLEYGTTYQEYGAEYTDLGTVSNEFVITHNIDPFTLGAYEVEYYIIDDAGNKSEVITRTVTVRDATSPVASLNPGVDTVIVNTEWTDAYVEASDNYTGDVIITIDGEVDLTTIGEYELTYNIADESGNVVRLKRIVNVVDMPTVEKLDFSCEDSTHTYHIGDNLDVPTCMFNYNDTKINTKEIDFANVDMSSPGMYTIYYKYEVEETEYIFRTFVYVLDTKVRHNDVAILPRRREY